MFTIQTLIDVADAYKVAAGTPRDSTVSSRVFADSKKLTALRGTADITTGRYNAALRWFADNWPADAPMPEPLREFVAAARSNAA